MLVDVRCNAFLNANGALSEPKPLSWTSHTLAQAGPSWSSCLGSCGILFYIECTILSASRVCLKKKDGGIGAMERISTFFCIFYTTVTWNEKLSKFWDGWCVHAEWLNGMGGKSLKRDYGKLTICIFWQFTRSSLRHNKHYDEWSLSVWNCKIGLKQPGKKTSVKNSTQFSTSWACSITDASLNKL